MTLAGPLGSDMPPIALRLGWLSLGSVGAHIPEVIQSIVEAGSQPKAMPISHWVCWRLWRGLATCRAWSGHRHRRRPLPTRRCHPCQKMRCSATWLALGGDMVLDCQLSAFALDVGGSLLERLVCYCLVAILVAPRLLRAGRKVFRPDWCTFARRHGAFMAHMPPFGCPCSLPLFRVCSSCCLLLAPMSLGHVRLFPPYILPSDRGPCGAPVVCWFGSRRIWLLVAMSSCGGFPAFSKLLQHRQRRRQPTGCNSSTDRRLYAHCSYTTLRGGVAATACADVSGQLGGRNILLPRRPDGDTGGAPKTLAASHQGDVSPPFAACSSQCPRGGCLR